MSLVLRNVRLGSGGPVTDVRIEADRVTGIGVGGSAESGSDVVDFAERTLLPGLWDAHVHLVQWASARRRVDVSDARSARQAADIIGDASRSPFRDRLLVGYGFRDGLWSDRPDKALLDAVAPDRAVVLISNDLHCLWLSSKALAVAGCADHATGVLRESEAYEAMNRLPEASADETDAWIADALAAAAERGVTGLQDFEIADNLTVWRRRAGDGLALRVSAVIYPPYVDHAIEAGLRTGMTLPDTGGLLTVGPVKHFVDGSLNTRTALCHDPYPGDDADRGLLEMPAGELEESMRRVSRHGLVPAVHAIGDEANTIALDAFERVRCTGRIEHAQLLDDGDLPRFARLGVVAGVQPAHTFGDRDVAERVWPGRTARAFRYADLLAAGAALEFGSDAPVSRLDPWDGIAAAVARTDGSREPWHPEQAIGLGPALAAAARGRRSVRVGDPADLIVVDVDPAELTAAELREMPVAGTLVAGRWVYRGG